MAPRHMEKGERGYSGPRSGFTVASVEGAKQHAQEQYRDRLFNSPRLSANVGRAYHGEACVRDAVDALLPSLCTEALLHACWGKERVVARVSAWLTGENGMPATAPTPRIPSPAPGFDRPDHLHQRATSAVGLIAREASATVAASIRSRRPPSARRPHRATQITPSVSRFPKRMLTGRRGRVPVV
jgi:hypothetical protein